MKCYLCQSTDFSNRKGAVRDAPQIQILECTKCGLVMLSSLDHIGDDFYHESGMHGDTLPPIEHWLHETERDDQRRFEMLSELLVNKKVLDFGCGAGGFVKKAQQLAARVEGVELEKRVQTFWGDRLTIYPDLSFCPDTKYDLITAFHVIEHIADPAEILTRLAEKLAAGGRMVIEVPSSEDALLSLYDSDAFSRFTYWSQHLYLLNAETLKRLAIKAGLRVISVSQYQRYPLSNHLYWLSQGKPGGHAKWSFLDNPQLTEAYAKSLAAMGKCDTIVAHLERQP